MRICLNLHLHDLHTVPQDQDQARAQVHAIAFSILINSYIDPWLTLCLQWDTPEENRPYHFQQIKINLCLYV